MIIDRSKLEAACAACIKTLPEEQTNITLNVFRGSVKVQCGIDPRAMFTETTSARRTSSPVTVASRFMLYMESE